MRACCREGESWKWLGLFSTLFGSRCDRVGTQPFCTQMPLMNRKGVPTYPQLRLSNFSSFILSGSGCIPCAQGMMQLEPHHQFLMAGKGSSSLCSGFNAKRHRFPSSWKVRLWLNQSRTDTYSCLESLAISKAMLPSKQSSIFTPFFKSESLSRGNTIRI